MPPGPLDMSHTIQTHTRSAEYGCRPINHPKHNIGGVRDLGAYPSFQRALEGPGMILCRPDGRLCEPVGLAIAFRRVLYNKLPSPRGLDILDNGQYGVLLVAS